MTQLRCDLSSSSLPQSISVARQIRIEIASSSLPEHIPILVMPELAGIPEPGESVCQPVALNVSVKAMGDTGVVELKWQSLKGARNYVVEAALVTMKPLRWCNAAETSKARVRIANLTSGAEYLFRVAAIGIAGQGPWSGEATGVVK